MNGSPCNECAMCRAVNEQRSMNVIEIDAASNNGVDNIREIREEVAYSPSEGKYKVYIIDEAVSYTHLDVYKRQGRTVGSFSVSSKFGIKSTTSLSRSARKTS